MTSFHPVKLYLEYTRENKLHFPAIIARISSSKEMGCERLSQQYWSTVVLNQRYFDKSLSGIRFTLYKFVEIPLMLAVFTFFVFASLPSC